MSFGVQANKAAELLAACNFDLNAVAKSIVTAIERKAEIDECFEPKVRKCWPVYMHVQTHACTHITLYSSHCVIREHYRLQVHALLLIQTTPQT